MNKKLAKTLIQKNLKTLRVVLSPFSIRATDQIIIVLIENNAESCR